MIYLCLIIVLLCIIILILSVKLHGIQKSVNEISTEFSNWLSEDTNNLIVVSSNDKYVRTLAKSINFQLAKLREEKSKYINGDRELKDAITNISHDLRTPLTAICGYMELLQDEECSPQVRDYLSRIDNRTQAMKQLTEELFKYSVVSTVNEYSFKEVDLKCALEDCLLSYYAAMTNRGITPEIQLTEKSIIRKLDESSLNRIFSNIISNALKYSSGDLKVEMNDSGKIIFSNSADNLTNIEVGRLFDRFFTVKSNRNSTGLGLSIAKLLTEKMGGNIYAEYEDNILSIILDLTQ